jgi:Predicted proteasome-type protease
MTYCVAIAVNDGLVFTSDSRTNAGVDQISTYSKMHQFGIPGMRQFVILSAGNLATTQGVIKKLEMDIKEGAALNLMSVSSMDDAADYLGQINLAQQSKYGSSSNVSYEASFIIGGQIKNSAPSLFLVYPQGNHIAPVRNHTLFTDW